jgi:hypothetical protein
VGKPPDTPASAQLSAKREDLTDRTIARTGSVAAMVVVVVASSQPGIGVLGPGILNTGMTPFSVMRTSAIRASMAAFGRGRVQAVPDLNLLVNSQTDTAHRL